MTMAAARIIDLVSSLPPLRGRVQANAPLAPFTWFRVGGPAEALVRPADEADLAQFLRALPLEIPVHVIGACSNLIIRDGGLPGVVVRLARGFGKVSLDGDGVVVGAAALDVTVSEYLAAAELTGLEFLSGIPGSIGGAVVMKRRRLWRRRRVLPRLGRCGHARRRTTPSRRSRSRLRLPSLASAARCPRGARPAARPTRCPHGNSITHGRDPHRARSLAAGTVHAPAVPPSAIRPT